MPKRSHLAYLTSVLIGVAPLAAGCSLTNITVDECTSNAACESAFGFGSTCNDGFCSEPQVCETGHDCRKAFGGGACVNGMCVDRLPSVPFGAANCRYEPENLRDQTLIGDDAPLVIGGMFFFEVDFSPPIIDAARLAVRQINGFGGLELGRNLAMVYCDNSGPMGETDGPEHEERTRQVVDYLAQTLGVPFMVGPLTSGDSFLTTQYMLQQGYPTLMVSPSATNPGLSLEPDRLNADDPFGLFWRTAPSDALQGSVLANSVVRTFPMMDPTIMNIAVPYRNDPYGIGLASAFSDAFSGSSSLQQFDVDSDLTAAAAAVSSGSPDGVLFIDIGGNRAVEFIAAMATQGITTPLYLADGSKNDALLDSMLPQTSKDIIFNNTVGTVAAGAEGSAFDLFRTQYNMEFPSGAADNAFTANGYDAIFVGAAGVVFAAQGGNNNYDGRNVAEGLSRLVGGSVGVQLGGLEWPNLKNGVTQGERRVDITGVSGPLDFDVALGQAPAAIEIWRPSMDMLECDAMGGGEDPPCFIRLTLISPESI